MKNNMCGKKKFKMYIWERKISLGSLFLQLRLDCSGQTSVIVKDISVSVVHFEIIM